MKRAARTIADQPSAVLLESACVAGAAANVSRGAGDAAQRIHNVQAPAPGLRGDAPDLHACTASMCVWAPDVMLRALTVAARTSYPCLNAPSAMRHSMTSGHGIRRVVSCRRRSGARAGGVSIVRPIHDKEE